MAEIIRFPGSKNIAPLNPTGKRTLRSNLRRNAGPIFALVGAALLSGIATYKSCDRPSDIITAPGTLIETPTNVQKKAINALLGTKLGEWQIAIDRGATLPTCDIKKETLACGMDKSEEAQIISILSKYADFKRANGSQEKKNAYYEVDALINSLNEMFFKPRGFELESQISSSGDLYILAYVLEGFHTISMSNKRVNVFLRTKIDKLNFIESPFQIRIDGTNPRVSLNFIKENSPSFFIPTTNANNAEAQTLAINAAAAAAGYDELQSCALAVAYGKAPLFILKLQIQSILAADGISTENASKVIRFLNTVLNQSITLNEFSDMFSDGNMSHALEQSLKSVSVQATHENAKKYLLSKGISFNVAVDYIEFQ